MMAMDHQGIMGLDITGYGNYGWATTTPVKSIADAKKDKVPDRRGRRKPAQL
jgi:hypothetical protein